MPGLGDSRSFRKLGKIIISRGRHRAVLSLATALLFLSFLARASSRWIQWCHQVPARATLSSMEGEVT
jgi:hypothetical protein